jgi:hypothetical protein
MGRALSVARVTVAADRQAEYLATIRELAALAALRGQHIWVFKSQRQADTFLEFSESPTPLSHRSLASRTPDEIRLEQRLHRAARYAPDAQELWEEVTLELPSETE